MLACVVACAAIFALTTLFTLGTGRFLFENDVAASSLAGYFLLGLGMCASMACLFSTITLLCGSRTHAIIWCMGIAFAALVLCLHTNQILVRPEFKDGLPNLHYAIGLRRTIYGILHDVNPYGQAAQLSSWRVWNPVRMVLCDLIWIVGIPALCRILFDRKNIQ